MIEGHAFATTLAKSEGDKHNTKGKLKVINLWAGPGAGKSTLAAAVFNLMKRERFEVEIIPEVAKAMTYEHAMIKLDNQLLVLAKQEHQLRRLIGQVEYAIVDSPFPMGLVYCKPWHVGRYQHLVDSLWDDYDNYDFYVKRTSKPYQTFGRSQTEQQARHLDSIIEDLWMEYSQAEFKHIDSDDISAEYRIIDYVLQAQDMKTLAQKHTEGAEVIDATSILGGRNE